MSQDCIITCSIVAASFAVRSFKARKTTQGSQQVRELFKYIGVMLSIFLLYLQMAKIIKYNPLGTGACDKKK